MDKLNEFGVGFIYGLGGMIAYRAMTITLAADTGWDDRLILLCALPIGMAIGFSVHYLLRKWVFDNKRKE